MLREALSGGLYRLFNYIKCLSCICNCMPCEPKTLSQLCFGYSAVGVMFMTWVWVMITKQPFYMKGLDDEKNCRDNAFGAIFVFLVLFLISGLYLAFDSFCLHRMYGSSSSYGDVEQMDFMLPPGMTDYTVNQEVVAASFSGEEGSWNGNGNGGSLSIDEDESGEEKDEDAPGVMRGEMT